MGRFTLAEQARIDFVRGKINPKGWRHYTDSYAIEAQRFQALWQWAYDNG